MDNRSRSLIYLKTSVLILAAILTALAVTARYQQSPISHLIFLAIAAHLPYGAALLAAWKARGKFKAGLPVVVTALALRLILVFAPPVFSDDVYRYVWDGKVLAQGTNPYRFSPEDPELEWLRDEQWTKINHKSMRTIYPPLGEAIFGAVALIAPHPVWFKVSSALSDTWVVCLVILLAGGRLRASSKPAEQNLNEKAIWAGFAYGLNPLACIETGMSGHLDSFAIALTLLALLLLKKGRGKLSGFVAGLGAGIKIAPVLVLPVIGRRQWLAWLIFPLVVVVLYLPFIFAGWNTVESLDAFARKWEGNAGLFALVKGGVQATIGFATGEYSADSMVYLPFLDPLTNALAGTFFSLHKDGGFDPARPGTFTLGDLSMAVSKLILSLGLIGTITTVTVRRIEPVRATALIFGVLVIITPVLHPWYLLWVLPLAAILGIWPWLLLAASIPLAYLPLDGWWAAGIWEAPLWVPWLEYGLFALAIVVYLALPCCRIVHS